MTQDSFRERKVLVVILGGGRGNRLFPLTKMRSKPAVPLAGKYRLIDIPISNCLHSGLNRIFVLTQFNSASLNQHIARTYNFDPFSRGFVEVLAAEQTVGSQEWFQGTADAVRKVFPHVIHQEWDQLLILSGDHLYRMNYLEMIERHLELGADMSVCVRGVHESEVSEFGLLKLDKNSRITEFREKPKTKPEYEPFRLDTSLYGYSAAEAKERPFIASMGIYIFNRNLLGPVLFDDTTLHDFGFQVIPNCVKRYKIGGLLFKDYWEDIGTIRSFFEANLSLCQLRPPFKLFHPTRPIYTRQRHLAASTIMDSHITHSIINDGCLIKKATIKHSVIGLRSYLDEGAVIEGSLILGADYYDGENIPKDKRIGIGKNARITGAIVDKNAHIGANVVIENKKQLKEYDDPEGRYYIRDGIVVVAKDARIPDGLVI